MDDATKCSMAARAYMARHRQISAATVEGSREDSWQATDTSTSSTSSILNDLVKRRHLRRTVTLAIYRKPRDRAAEAKNGVEIAYAAPSEGAVVWTDVAAIPAGCPKCHTGPTIH